MRLSELEPGETAVITKILGHGAFRKRVMEMGFVRGRKVNAVLQAPLHDPIKYSIMGYEVSLRRSEAKLIEVDDVKSIPSDTPLAKIDITEAEMPLQPAMQNSRHKISVVLIGNPNCGKTSLFNNLTGRQEHVGNYSGVTVDAITGNLVYGGYEIEISDLPGTYSLASYSPEEKYVRKYLREHTPDVIINVVDASNIERNLYLTTELIDMDRSMVIALNMYDELQKSGAELDFELLGQMIGVPIVPTISKNGRGVSDLLDAVIAVYEGKCAVVRHIHVNLGNETEKPVTILKDLIKENGHTGHHVSPRYMAIKLLERDKETEEHIAATPGGMHIIAVRDKILFKAKEHRREDISETIAAEKYGFIAGALAETLRKPLNRRTATAIIDAIVTDKYVGFPIFFALMLVTFWLTFSLGEYPMQWMQWGVDKMSLCAHHLLAPGILRDLVADGIIGGVGGVIVFLPNILILYFCISFMEDTGYMARAAFIMDRVMHKIGLHGKSFIPMIMGFGCNVPAIMAARTIESRSSRIITILINPFMSCSARLPIYVLMVGTFFPNSPTMVFMGLYILGIAIAVITAKILRKFKYKNDDTPFVMELPPYRMPTFKTSLQHMWAKGEQYLKKMAGLILVASIIVWGLNYFPVHNPKNDSNVGSLSNSADISADSDIDPEHDSYLEMCGKFVNPALKPLGFNWKATVAALAGIPAKEIVVSTLGVLYTNDEAVSDEALGARLTEVNPTTHESDFDMASALSFMVFILLYCPCSATLIIIAKEAGDLKYAVFSALYNTGVAWVMAFAVYRLALLFV